MTAEKEMIGDGGNGSEPLYGLWMSLKAIRP